MIRQVSAQKRMLSPMKCANNNPQLESTGLHIMGMLNPLLGLSSRLLLIPQISRSHDIFLSFLVVIMHVTHMDFHECICIFGLFVQCNVEIDDMME